VQVQVQSDVVYVELAHAEGGRLEGTVKVALWATASSWLRVVKRGLPLRAAWMRVRTAGIITSGTADSDDTSSGDMFSYVGAGPGSIPDRANDAVSRWACRSSTSRKRRIRTQQITKNQRLTFAMNV
jgi:hypothetical protein